MSLASLVRKGRILAKGISKVMMPLAFYLDFATKQEGLRRFIDSKGLLSPRIGSLSCRPLPPSDNKGRDLAVIKQILHGYILSERKIRVPSVYTSIPVSWCWGAGEKWGEFQLARRLIGIWES